ncbi:DUF6351 family protein [Variovorax terrae]|uniref:DUF6351 family protein n=1 Tax=Variovorax terrae TaxID=2923278 RepID=A0A9X1W3L2_9BURK|nr:DUF6351 family protein [Variovorax terrae]MCJ0765233.1 DUF6351 family protein [Variovorax terrae]
MNLLNLQMHGTPARRRLACGLTVAAVAAALLAACGGSDGLSPGPAGPPGGGTTVTPGPIPELRVLSGRADLVSGGDALVQLLAPAGVAVASLQVDLDGKDVTAAFALRADGRYYGLISGLKVGKNQLRARVPGKDGAKIELTNYPIGGPLISGPQVKPWTCTTKVASPTLTNPDLGDPVDDQCNIAAPVYRYQYRTLGGSFATYDPNSPPAAAAIASITTDAGVTLPYIVRIERGVINRGKYDIAYLASPSDPTKGWRPWEASPSWNHKLFWKFGSGCEYGRTQVSPGSVMDDSALRRGFMVASSEMTNYGSHCNDVTSAETVIMMKEYIAKRYGEIRFTMSDGGSGGAHQQNLHSANYPGLIQGMLPTQTFQDTWTPGREFADCGLLKRFYTTQDGTSTTAFGVAEKTAVNGHRWNQVCEGPASINMASRQPYYMDPTIGDQGCGGQTSTWSLTNLAGIRCTLQDFNIAIFGPRDATGYARSPQDNTGIQYGLNALNGGRITPEKFVTLNEQIGGYDINGQWQAARMKADPGAVDITHRSGRVAHARYLGEVAIIDRRDFNITEEHYDFRAWVIRNRLLKEFGDYGNQIIWRYKTAPANLADRAFETMNQWLTNVEADKTGKTLRQKVLGNKPTAAVDSCWRSDLGVWSTDTSYCNLGPSPSMAASTTGTGSATVASPTLDEWPVYRDTRTAAGEPLTSDIMQCQLKPLVRSDYFVAFTDAQWNRLAAVFPGGVCDYGKPGVSQVAPEPWQTFKDGPGGKPLGPVPTSSRAS